MTQDGVAYLPEMRTQPVAARVVAETLADAAEEPEIENGRISEVAGPREERLADVAAALFASRGDTTEIREVRQSGDPDAAAYAEGAVLPNPGAKLGRPKLRRVARLESERPTQAGCRGSRAIGQLTRGGTAAVHGKR